MKTFESAALAKNAVSRLLEVAITEDQFKKWPTKQQRDWIRDHPNSKFAKEAKKVEKPLTKKVEKPKASSDDKKNYVPYKVKFTEMPTDVGSIIIDRTRTNEDRKKSEKILKEFETDLNNQVKHMEKNTGHGYTPSAVKSLAERSRKLIDTARKLDPMVDEFNKALRGFIEVRESGDAAKMQAAAGQLDNVLWKYRKFRGPALTLAKKGRFLRSVSVLAKGCTLRLEYMAKARDQAVKEAKQAGMTDKQKNAAFKRSADMRARWGSMS